jgi:hypothetical protein
MNATTFLPVIRSNTELDLMELLPVVEKPAVTLPEILMFCHLYRLRGIAALLLDADVERIHGDLRKSGQAFLHFLKSTAETNKLTSQADPFFDSVASKDFQCAREIASLSRTSWAVGEEFEDDFMYVYLLMKLFFLDCGNLEKQELLEHYRQISNPGEDPRVAVCLALANVDASSFDKALEGFLAHRQDRYKKLAAKEAVLPEDLATEGNISCEGLALIRLAESAGLVTQKEYLFIPSLARLDVSARLDGNWRAPQTP